MIYPLYNPLLSAPRQVCLSVCKYRRAHVNKPFQITLHACVPCIVPIGTGRTGQSSSFFFPRPEPEVPERKSEQVRRVTNTKNRSKEFFGTFSFEFRYVHPIISLSPNHFQVNHPRTPYFSDPRLRCILCFSFDSFLSVF